LGIRVELAALDNSTYWATMMEDAGQIHRAGWCPDYNDANNYTYDVMFSTGAYNYGRWNSPVFDDLVTRARVELDPQARRELYRQAEQLMVVEDAALMPLYWVSVVQLTKPYVERTYEVNAQAAYWKWDISQ